MGEAKRRSRNRRREWPHSESHRGVIELHSLAPAPSIDGAYMRRVTGDRTVSEKAQVILRTFRAVVGDRTFHVGFCLGDGERFSAVGIAVIDRLKIEVSNGPIHVVPIVHEDIAWDIVLRHLRSFTGQVLLFAFSDSDVYDAGTAQIHFSEDVQCFDDASRALPRLTWQDRRRIRSLKAEMLERPAPPMFYEATGVAHDDSPWIFRFATPVGKVIRTAVWDGRRDYAHEMPEDIARWVGGERVAIVQVEIPVGVDRRSSLDLTHKLASDFDGVIHWARDTGTFQSIVRSFIRLDLMSVPPPELPIDWKPEVTIFSANSNPR